MYASDYVLEVPIVRNINGYTVLDVIFGRKLFHERLDKNFFWRQYSQNEEDKYKADKSWTEPQCSSPNTAAIIFKLIKDYSYMHSGYQLSWVVVNAISI